MHEHGKSDKPIVPKKCEPRRQQTGPKDRRFNNFPVSEALWPHGVASLVRPSGSYPVADPKWPSWIIELPQRGFIDQPRATPWVLVPRSHKP